MQPLKLVSNGTVEPSDEALMSRVRADDREALRALANRHMPRVLDFCTKMVGDRSTAEEIAQETWLELWRARSRYEPRARFVVFLLTIARRRALNDLRARKRRATWLSPIADVDAEPAPSSATSDELRDRVHGALGELSPALREALVLRYGEELSYEQMAPITGAKESTLRSRVFHAVRALRSLLGESE